MGVVVMDGRSELHYCSIECARKAWGINAPIFRMRAVFDDPTVCEFCEEPIE